MTSPVLIQFHQLSLDDGTKAEERIATVAINQPKTANAMSGEILVAMAEAFQTLAKDTTVRAVLIQSVGKHFSAGANLKWMQEAAKLSQEKNREEAEKLISMFESLVNLPMPTIAVAKGAAYGGAVGLVAACDFAIALDNAKFCLSEARIGLIPAVILPYLSRKMSRGALRRYTLSAQVFNGTQALDAGLVDKVVTAEEMETVLGQELSQLLGASPQAQKAYKDLQVLVDEHKNAQGGYTADAIAAIRASELGQEGLAAFFDKRKPSWHRKLTEGTELFLKPE